ncbi:MAG: hypothetical protein QXK17_00930 [Metallosphaera sp.]
MNSGVRPRSHRTSPTEYFIISRLLFILVSPLSLTNLSGSDSLGFTGGTTVCVGRKKYIL